MDVRIVRYSICFFIMQLFAGVCLAEQEDSVNKDVQSLHRQVTLLQQQIKDANDRHTEEMKLLREEIELLKQGQTNIAYETKDAETNQSPVPIAAYPEKKQPGAAPGYQSFNPDISAIGDVLFHAGKNDENEKKNQFQFRELELGISSIVDPYGRADFFISIEEEDGEAGIDLEEGYFTFDTLPYDLKARAGKFLSAFGKINTFHTHALPWVDEPDVIQNFFGEEGMREPGAELSWLIPNPWNNYMELIFQAQNNGNELSFAGEESDDLMYVTHLKNFFDLDRTSTLELGGSFATGHNAATGGGNRTNIEGLDLTYKWRHPEQGLYKSLIWMNELLLSQKEQGVGDAVNSYGLYSSLEYQFYRRWSVFGRYDYSQFPDDDKSHENAYSTGLTFRQSEFAFWRLQYKHTDADGSQTTDNSRDELFLQLNFGIGPHRAHQY